MGGGYVLNFTNREFEEFMKDVVSYSIYQKYPGLSKAKMLRRFIEEESDTYVGKMIILLVNYMRENLLDKNISQEDINKLYELGKIKLGKVPTNHKAQKSRKTKVQKQVKYEQIYKNYGINWSKM